jgi:hypothetical protein
MISSGVQKPAPKLAEQVLSCGWLEAGTANDGRQCAPVQPQVGSVVGSMTGGGVGHGHVKMTGGFLGESQPSEQAPVCTVGVADVGS